MYLLHINVSLHLFTLLPLKIKSFLKRKRLKITGLGHEEYTPFSLFQMF